MEPVTAEQDAALETPTDEELRLLENSPEEEEDDVDLENDEDDEDDEDQDDDLDDDDDDVATDEDGNEMLKVRDPPASAPVPDQQAQAAPNVSSDRVPATDAEPEGSLDRVKTAPLGIQEIENLEDDAKGG